MSSDNSKRFYVYIHRREDNNAIFYVGKGSKHRAYNKSTRNRHWKCIEQSCGRTVELVESFATEEEAFQHELFLICSFKVFGVRLANVVEGGGGAVGYKHTPEAKASMTAKRKGKPLSEYHYSRLIEAQKQEGVSAKRSASLLAYYADPQARERVAKKNRENNTRPEVRKKISESLSAARRALGRVRQVRCLTNGVQFDCIVDAAKWLSIEVGKDAKKTKSGIQNCVGRPHKSYLGTKWEYIEKNS
jgi:hypothetical protein